MKNFIIGYLKFTGFQELSRQLFKGVMRANPKRHAQLIAYQSYLLDLEMDLYDRMHNKTPTKAPEPETADDLK